MLIKAPRLKKRGAFVSIRERILEMWRLGGA